MSNWKELEFQKLAYPAPGSFSMGPFGSAITTDNYVPQGVPVVRGVNLSRGIFTDDEFVYLSDEKADELSRANLIAGDLVFTHRGTIGQVSMIPRHPRFARYVLSSSQVKARLDPSIAVPEFYYYWFRSPRGQHSLLANASVVGVPGISRPLATLKALVVPYPPTTEQAKIAQFFGAFDDKIAVNDRIGAAALDLALAKYKSWASAGKLSSTISMADSGRWLSGGTPNTAVDDYWGGDIPWISASSLKTPWIGTAERNLTVLGTEGGTRLVPMDTIIFVVRGMSLSKEFRVGLTMREVAFGQDCKALIPAPWIDSATLFIAIKSRTSEILRLVDHAGHGTGRLATDLISKVMLDMPSDSNSSSVAGTLRPLIAVGAARQAESRTLRELRDTLLPKVMSGEIRVRDAEKVVEDVT